MKRRSVRVGPVQLTVGIEPETVARLRGRPIETFAPVRSAPAPLADSARDAADAARRAEVAAIDWYHVLDLGDGLVTPGAFDLRAKVGEYRLPARLDGLRCLDAATFDGFWAFEMERRGAGEVVAIDLEHFADLDLPRSARAQMAAEDLAAPIGKGFAVAHRLLGSRVRRQVCSLYDLSPERTGMFDVVFCASVLLHLQNPMRALERLASVTRGRAIITDYVDPNVPAGTLAYEGGTIRCTWWRFSPDVLHRMIEDAGFRNVREVNRFPLDPARHGSIPHAVFHADAP